MKTPTPWPPLAALSCATLTALAPAQADALIGLDVTATPSWGLRGDANNTVVWLDIGAGGLLRIEFYALREKTFAANLPDGRWVSGSLTFDVTAAPVPEPQGYALMGAGLLALGFLRGRSRRRQ